MTYTTRFAPSPTGMLHIGGARTALFNALLARRHKGKFLLRLEDTDKARSTPEATQAILSGLNWLGLQPDDDPVFQSANAARHLECAEQMIAAGTAFYCRVTPEELQARRDAGHAKRAAAKADGTDKSTKTALLAEADALLSPYRSVWRDRRCAPDPGTPCTIRLKAPDHGQVSFDDGVRGTVSVAARDIDDLVLVRADGTPTYMLAVVVDDHDMGVSCVLRGDDHFRNTFRQIPIYQAMGWTLPQFVHVPLIHGTDGTKLSKRHGALSTLEYRDTGYLPEALCAYLLRLGWSCGDREIFTMQEASDLFGTGGLNKAPARLDMAKLRDVNACFIRRTENRHLLALMRPAIAELTDMTPDIVHRLESALPALKQRGSTMPELVAACRFLWDNHADKLTNKAAKALAGEGRKWLAGFRPVLAQLKSWRITTLQQALELYCTDHKLSVGQVGPALRAALSGGLPAPDLASVMFWLGKPEVLARMDRHLVTDN